MTSHDRKEYLLERLVRLTDSETWAARLDLPADSNFYSHLITVLLREHPWLKVHYQQLGGGLRP